MRCRVCKKMCLLFSWGWKSIRSVALGRATLLDGYGANPGRSYGLVAKSLRSYDAGFDPGGNHGNVAARSRRDKFHASHRACLGGAGSSTVSQGSEREEQSGNDQNPAFQSLSIRAMCFARYQRPHKSIAFNNEPAILSNPECGYPSQAWQATTFVTRKSFKAFVVRCCAKEP